MFGRGTRSNRRGVSGRSCGVSRGGSRFENTPGVPAGGNRLEPEVPASGRSCGIGGAAGVVAALGSWDLLRNRERREGGFG